MMTNLLLDITSATIDWSRAQFALTAIYHWLFVPLTLGLAVIMGIAETCYYRYQTNIMIVCVVLLVLMVQVFQTVGTLWATKSDKRLRK